MTDEFDWLVRVVANELTAQFAVERFGWNLPIPDAQHISTVAMLIADVINDWFVLELKAPIPDHGEIDG
jgi:hypothetical protein